MLRLVTYNLESLGEGHGMPSLDARIAVLRPRLVGLAADILALQEIDGQHPAKARPRQPLALQRVLAGTVYTQYHLAATPGPSGRGVADRHNLITLSRHAVADVQSMRHELVAPPKLRASPFGEIEAPFDRPILHTQVAVAGGRRLHVINLHLRAPLAVPIAGERTETGAWATASAWAVGYQLAAMKRTAQALEARLLVDRLLDADGRALIAVCGDLNATEVEMPTRILSSAVTDTANPLLESRALVPLAEAVPAERRFSVRHRGRPMLVDHILASRALADLCREVKIDNRGLLDELVAEHLGPAFLDSTHAPIVASFALG